MKKSASKTPSKKKDPLAVKDLSMSKGKASNVKGGYAPKITALSGCNTNTITCKTTSFGCD